MLLLMPDIEAGHEFFTRLGFRLSDKIIVPGRLNARFYHCNARHHTLALGQCPPGVAGPQPPDDPGGLDRRRRHRLRDRPGAGRAAHPDPRPALQRPAVQLLPLDPSSFHVEYGFGGLEVDEETWVPRVYDRTAVWGHQPHPDGKGRPPGIMHPLAGPGGRWPPLPRRPEHIVSTVPAPFEAAEALVGVGPGPTPTQRRERLRSLLSDGTLVLPGATDALGVRLIESAGFDAAYATGAGLANAQYGIPDIGLISLGEVADHVDRMASATTLPLVVDADTGFGNPVMAMRAARRSRAGRRRRPPARGPGDAQAVRSLRPPRAHPGRSTCRPSSSRSARRSRTPQRCVIARTDARSVHDIDEAIRRGHAYVEAGRGRASSSRRRAPWRSSSGSGASCAASRWSSTSSRAARPPSSASRSTATLGFGVVLFANFLMRAMMRAGAEALAHLPGHGETGVVRATGSRRGSERQALFHLPEFSAAEAHFDAPGERS